VRSNRRSNFILRARGIDAESAIALNKLNVNEIELSLSFFLSLQRHLRGSFSLFGECDFIKNNRSKAAIKTVDRTSWIEIDRGCEILL
jgi:hypothetical protein